MSHNDKILNSKYSLSQINTCASEEVKPSTSLITDYKKDETIQEVIKKMFGIRNSNNKPYNPCSNPISISREKLNSIDPQNYVVSEKTDGVRYLLVLCRDNNNNHVSVMVNRICEKYEVSLCAASKFFDGSVFDGELVLENNCKCPRLVYLIFDVIAVKGNSVRLEDYIKRSEKINNIFADPENYPILMKADETKRNKQLAIKGKIIASENKYNLYFKPKPWFFVNEIDNLWQSISNLNHKSDGLIFTPINIPLSTGTDWNLLKWKQRHTLDLQLQLQKINNNWEIGLLYTDDSEIEQISFTENLPLQNACQGFEFNERKIFFTLAQNDLVIKLVSNLEKMQTYKFTCIAECNAQFSGNKLLCLIEKIRYDKSTPNNSFTIYRTLQNIEESISYEELRNILYNKVNHPTCSPYTEECNREDVPSSPLYNPF